MARRMPIASKRRARTVRTDHRFRSGLAFEPLEGRALMATLYVATTGSDGNGPGNPGAPLRTIQHAVTVAGSGDVILVAAGTYTYDGTADAENGINYAKTFGTATVFTVFRKQISVVGGYSASNWGAYNPSANPTILDGLSPLGPTRGILVEGFAGSTSLFLKGVTVMRGYANGLAARGGVPADPEAGGGGMLVNSAPVTIQDVLFTQNAVVSAATAGEVGFGGGGGAISFRSTSSATTANLTNVAFVGNVAQGGRGATRGGYGQGGGFFATNYTVNGTNLVFTNNQAIGGPTDGYGRDTTGEQADGLGGGFDIHIGAIGNFNGVVASGNVARGGDAPNGNGGGGFGGALYAERGALNVANVVARYNTARGGDGLNGASAAAGFGNGGGLMTLNSNTNINKSEFEGNVAQGGNSSQYQGVAGGGGVALVRDPTKLDGTNTSATIYNSVIADNTVSFGSGPNIFRADGSGGGGGGGIWLDGPTATIAHTTIAQNRLVGSLPNAAYMRGQGILAGPSNRTVANLAFNFVANHFSASNSGGIVAAALDVNGANGSVANTNRNLFDRNSKDINAVGLNTQGGGFNIVAPSTTTQAAPGFLAPGAPNFNYRISSASPAVGLAATSNIPDDRLGVARVGVPDAGAYEYVPPTPPPPTDPLILKPFGGPDDVPIAGDFDGDGKTDYGVYGPAGKGFNRFAVLRSSDGVTQLFEFGGGGDLPIVGDFDGDRKADYAVYGPAGNGFNRFAIQQSTAGFRGVLFGGASDQAIAADFDGDGRTDIAVYGPIGNGFNRYAIAPSSGGFFQLPFGLASDQAVVGDYDGDRKTDYAVYGPAGNFSRFAVQLSRSQALVNVPYGALTDRPVAGDYNGDGLTDIGVYGPAGNGVNRFAIRLGAGVVKLFGGPADQAVVADYDGDKKTDIAVYVPGRFASIPSSQSSTFAGAARGFAATAAATEIVPLPGSSSPVLSLFNQGRPRNGGFLA